MPYYQLHVDVEFDGLQLIGFPPTVEPTLRCSLRCSACSEVNKNAIVSLADAHESEDNKSILHYSAVCKVCKSAIKVWISRLPALVKENVLKKDNVAPWYINDYYCQIGTRVAVDNDDDDNKKAPKNNTLFAVVEARGAEVIDWEVFNTEFHATQDAKEFFIVGDLCQDGFYDVNNENESISVTLNKYYVK